MKCLLAIALFLVSATTAMAVDKAAAPGLSDRHWPVKGGVAIISAQLHVVVNGESNELISGDGSRWTGQARGQPEVAVYFQGKVWPKDGLPKDFDLRQAIVISFEAEVVRFFDFAEKKGGYYARGPAGES